MEEFPGTGTHISFNEANLNELDPNVPYQIFLRADSGHPPRGTPMPTTMEKKLYKSIIQRRKLNIFVHGLYTINLIKPAALKMLEEELITAREIGARGVVIHVGKAVNDEETDLKAMKKYFRAALEEATENCPLLLETPAGQGSEMLVIHSEMKEFFEDFTEEEKKKSGLCVDTCHVFADGYIPWSYICWAYNNINIDIKLIHFNDSKNERGSLVDRHALPGKGKIGFEQLNKVYTLCKELGVPMIVEPPRKKEED